MTKNDYVVDTLLKEGVIFIVRHRKTGDIAYARRRGWDSLICLYHSQRCVRSFRKYKTLDNLYRYWENLGEL